MSPARSLQLSPSATLAALIVAAHLAAAIAVAAALPGWPGGLLAAGLGALGLAAAWSRALLRSRRSVRCIRIEADKASVELAGGESFPVEPAGHVSRFMVTLASRRPPHRLLVTADMLGGEAFRALRVWALWGKVPVARKQLAA